MLSLFDQGPPPPCPRSFNLAAHVLALAPELGDKTALSVLGGAKDAHYSFATLEQAVRGIGTGLLRAGLIPGDIVLMRLGNTPEFPLAYLGALAVGLVPVPTSSQLTEAETARIIEELSPKAVLRDPGIACAPHDLQISLSDLALMHELPPCAYDMGDPDRLGYIVYTSGTSGKPRAVAHAHRAIWARQMMIRDWYDLHQSDRMLHAGAFNWTYTLGTGLMDPWSVGASALIPAPGTNPGDLAQLLAQHKASIFAAAPGVYRKILNVGPLPDLPDLRHGLSAGEKLSANLHNAWKNTTGTDLFEAYGMSECSTFISACPTRPALGDALGQPQPGRRVAILGPDGIVNTGEEGTIAVHERDPGLMLGYLNAPEETAARMRDGWFLTGDQGAMDNMGQITYLGRGDDMMNAGGYRVSPLEVEAALSDHPGITQVGVTDVEVKKDARVIVAFYTGPEALDPAALSAYVEVKLARYKHPRAYVHLPELPMGANGKLLRRALAPFFKADLT